MSDDGVSSLALGIAGPQRGAVSRYSGVEDETAQGEEEDEDDDGCKVLMVHGCRLAIGGCPLRDNG